MPELSKGSAVLSDAPEEYESRFDVILTVHRC